MNLAEKNADFWDFVCGSGMVAQKGLNADRSRESLSVFDRHYFNQYPWLLETVGVNAMGGKDVLEVGVGYGTLARAIVGAGARYFALDIASAPVEILRSCSIEAERGDFLSYDFGDRLFDFVVSIGCFHHTGDTQGCIDRSHGLLRPGGQLVGMVYNHETRPTDGVRDKNLLGAHAPHTDYYAKAEVSEMLGGFSASRVETRNTTDDIYFWGTR